MSTSQHGEADEPYVRVDVAAARKLIVAGTVQVVDVREPNEYADGHIPGATLVPLNALRASPRTYLTGEPALFVSTLGRRSVVACEIAAAGLNPSYTLDGGMSAWIRAGLTFELGPADVGPGPRSGGPSLEAAPSPTTDWTFRLSGLEERVLRVGRWPRHDAMGGPEVNLQGLPGFATVARLHAKLFFRDGQWFVRAVGAPFHLTFVDGRRLQDSDEVPLHVGCELRFGEVVLTLHRRPGDETDHLMPWVRTASDDWTN